jgi:hypothetical protein
MNPTDTLVVVSGYSGDAQQISAFLPEYRHHGCEVLVLSPEDSPIPRGSLVGVHHEHVGRVGYVGPHTLERQRLSMERLLRWPYRQFLWHDSDSVCLSRKLPRYLFTRPEVLWCNVVRDTNTAPSLLPKFALQPPYFLTRGVLQRLLEGAKQPATSYYMGADLSDADKIPVPTGCIDHWMLQVAHSGGVEYLDFPDGACFETRSSHGLETMAELVRNHGKVMVHSVKTRQVLNRLLMERRGFVAAQKNRR